MGEKSGHGRYGHSRAKSRQSRHGGTCWNVSRQSRHGGTCWNEGTAGEKGSTVGTVMKRRHSRGKKGSHGRHGVGT